MNKSVSLLRNGFDNFPWLGKRAFTPATDNLFSDRIQRIIVRTSACKTAHFHLICQFVGLLSVFDSSTKLYTSCILLVYYMQNISSSSLFFSRRKHFKIRSNSCKSQANCFVGYPEAREQSIILLTAGVTQGKKVFLAFSFSSPDQLYGEEL